MIKDINILKSLNILYAEDDLVIKESTTAPADLFVQPAGKHPYSLN